MSDRIATTAATQAGFRSRGLPRQAIAGPLLVAVFWTISWTQWRPVSDYAFTPLWLGYILTVDGVLLWRTGTSPLARAGARWLWFFAASVPLWWVFELLNERAQNWRYLTPVRYSAVEYALLASIAFSTVIPAVLTTTELLRSLRLDPLRRLPAWRLPAGGLLATHLAGWLMLAALLVWPRYFFPVVWLALIFILDPLVDRLGGRSLARYLRRGDWSPVFNLAAATLICGWFWEMWNFYALPKWIYAVPFVGVWRVWEMPLLGYGGYIPFGVEIFVFYSLIARLLRRANLPWTYVSSRDDTPAGPSGAKSAQRG